MFRDSVQASESGNLAAWKVGVRESEGEVGGIGVLKEVAEGGAERAELQKVVGCPFFPF